MHYSGSIKYPLGIFDHPDDQPGVSSFKIPDNQVTRRVRQFTEFVEWMDDNRPGLGDLFSLLH